MLPRVYHAGRERLHWHGECGDCIVIISATGEYLEASIAEQLGALAMGVEVSIGRFIDSTCGSMTCQQTRLFACRSGWRSIRSWG